LVSTWVSISISVVRSNPIKATVHCGQSRPFPSLRSQSERYSHRSLFNRPFLSRITVTLYFIHVRVLKLKFNMASPAPREIPRIRVIEPYEQLRHDGFLSPHVVSNASWYAGLPQRLTISACLR